MPHRNGLLWKDSPRPHLSSRSWSMITTHYALLPGSQEADGFCGYVVRVTGERRIMAKWLTPMAS